MYRELLRLATQLATNTVGRPRWVSRNRAVSTAYYAVFHAVAELCAREMVGAWAPWEPFRHVYRSLDHGHARRVFKDIAGDPSIGIDAKTLARCFLDLQKEREGADYDPGYRVSPGRSAELLLAAEQSCGLAFRLPAHERKLLAARLIGRTRS